MSAISRVPVSVIIPFYNGQAYIDRAIASIQSQTLLPLEIVIVDDGSPVPIDREHLNTTYASASVPVRIVHHETNRGIPAARNTGVRASVGSFVAFLDQDDEWLPEKLSLQWKMVEREGGRADKCVFYGRALRMLDDGTWIAWPRVSLMRVLDGPPERTLRLLITEGNPLPFITLLFSKAVWERVGGFDEDVRGGGDDYALLLAFAASGIRLCGAGADRSVLARRHETGSNYSDARRFLDDDVSILERLGREHPATRPYIKRGLGAAYYRAGRSVLDRDIDAGKALLHDALTRNPGSIRLHLALAAAHAPLFLRKLLLKDAWNSVRRVRGGVPHQEWLA